MITHATDDYGIERDARERLTLAQAPDFLTVRELGQLLRIGRNQAYALVAAGQVESCRIGGSIRVPKAAVERLAQRELTEVAGA